MTDREFVAATEVLGVVTLLVFGALAVLIVVFTIRRSRNPNWRRDLWISQNASRPWWVGTAVAAAIVMVPLLATLLVLIVFPVAPILVIALVFGAVVVLSQGVLAHAIARRPPEDSWFRESDEPDDRRLTPEDPAQPRLPG